MKYVTVEIPEPLYNAAVEEIRVGLMEPDPKEIERRVKVYVEQGLYNYIDATLNRYWLDENCPQHKMYEKAFEYMREFLEGYFQRIEEIKREVYGKYRKEKNEDRND